MQDKHLRRNLEHIARASCLLCALACLSAAAQADQTPNILCRPNLSLEHRTALANKLRAITGWTELTFDDHGALSPGPGRKAIGGSRLSRDLISEAISGSRLLVLEDASNRSDVVFARVVEGRWTRDAPDKPPVYLILVDFADFSHIIGNEATLASFNEGWAVLHEIAHVVHGSEDANGELEPGECETLINRMRRECGVPERAEYYFRFFPGQEATSFATRFVRLAFDLQSTGTKKKKRSWIIWDGILVGGIDTSTQVASGQLDWVR